MRLVTFSRDMAPHGPGDQLLLPDDIADEFGRQGALSASTPWPAPAADGAAPFAPPPARPTPTPAPAKPARRVVRPARPSGTPDTRVAQ